MEPIISIGYDRTVSGDWTATLTVSGLRTERQAQIAVAYLRERCCGQEIEPNDATACRARAQDASHE